MELALVEMKGADMAHCYESLMQSMFLKVMTDSQASYTDIPAQGTTNKGLLFSSHHSKQ